MSKKLIFFMMLTLIAMLSIFAMFSGQTRQNDALTAILQKQPLIVDVRTPDEFNSGHIEGAKNYPLQQLPQYLGVIKSAGKPVVVYCRSGARSSQAQQYLSQQGITEVVNGGGIDQLRTVMR
jgi:phage shock protein E